MGVDSRACVAGVLTIFGWRGIENLENGKNKIFECRRVKSSWEKMSTIRRLSVVLMSKRGYLAGKSNA